MQGRPQDHLKLRFQTGCFLPQSLKHKQQRQNEQRMDQGKKYSQHKSHKQDIIYYLGISIAETTSTEAQGNS